MISCQILFNKALEPLARFLEDSWVYRGISVGTEEIKIALFSDDMILFMSNLHSDLAGVFEEISSFGLFSDHKINVTKSEAHQLGPPAAGNNSFGGALM